VQLYSPWLLLLLIIFIPLMLFLGRRRGVRAPLRFSSLREAGAVRPSWRIRLRGLLTVARLICITLLIVALARPRQGTTFEKVSTNGVVMELVVDRSGSMKTKMKYQGRELSRLEVVKLVLADFVKGTDDLAGRESDLLGLVTFARYADTICPLVHSHDTLLGFLKQSKVVPDRSPENATAIGDALALAAARLKKAEEEITKRNAKLKATVTDYDDNGEQTKPEFEIRSKVIVLLTDGRQNAGKYLPAAAAQLAKDWGIKIYTIGIGGGQLQTRMQGLFGDFMVPMRQELDEGLLKAIAEQTGGFYGRAGDGQGLQKIIEKIDQQEKTEIESLEYSRYEERFGPWALMGLLVLTMEMLMNCTIFRKIP